MTTEIVFETHSTTVDNELGLATGWLPGTLSEEGRRQAARLGARRRDDGVDVVFASDLARAVETADVAFSGTPIPLLFDWRLRECDYGEHNGSAARELHQHRLEHLDVPYPGGESWREAIGRVERFLADLPPRWIGGRILVLGHTATRWALDHALDGQRLEDLLVADFEWQEGWEYRR
jgi:2,3-bisphosphoglycerate-dependent phosphoglycerate mutase